MEKYDFGDFGGVTGEDPFERGSYAGTPEDQCLSSPRGDVYYWVTRCGAENAPWLVLLHGAGMDHTVFDAVTETFSRSVNCIALDLPLHGLSENYGAFAPDSCAYDVRDILNNEGVDRAVVTGHCIGGVAAQAFAAEFPERCAGLALIDTFPFGQELCHYGDFRWLDKTAGLLRVMPARAFAGALAGAFAATTEGSRALYPVMAAQNTACAADALADTLAALSGTAAPDWDFPVLAMVGEGDRVGRIRALNRAAAARFGWKLATVRHAGHTPYLDNPSEFNAALEGFLRGM